MKLYGRPNELHSYRTNNVYAGVYVSEDNEIYFNWCTDDTEDIMNLASLSSGQFDDNGVRYFYAYQYTSNAPYEKKKLFRDSLKGKLDPEFLLREDVEDFVDSGLLEFNKFSNIGSYSLLVHTESSSDWSLMTLLGERFTEFNIDDTDIALMKKMYKDVQFDAEAAFRALLDAGYSEHRARNSIQRNVAKFEALKKTNQLFQMKRFIPPAVRHSFYDFLKFKTDEERQLYESLQGVDVLIYDDFLTSGVTVKEVIRLLRSVHEMNRLTVFVLIKQ